MFLNINNKSVISHFHSEYGNIDYPNDYMSLGLLDIYSEMDKYGYVQIDEKIIEFIIFLNDLGLKTEACCSGHYPYKRLKMDDGSVYDEFYVLFSRDVSESLIKLVFNEFSNNTDIQFEYMRIDGIKVSAKLNNNTADKFYEELHSLVKKYNSNKIIVKTATAVIRNNRIASIEIDKD